MQMSCYQLFLPEGISDIFIWFVSKLQFFEFDSLLLKAFTIRHNMIFEIGVGGQVEDVSDLLGYEVVCVLRCGLVPKKDVVKDLVSGGGLQFLGLDNCVHFLVGVRSFMIPTSLVTTNGG